MAQRLSEEFMRAHLLVNKKVTGGRNGAREGKILENVESEVTCPYEIGREKNDIMSRAMGDH
jgi:hypothetical protein